MTEVLQMGWPFAVVLVALFVVCAVIYGLKRSHDAERESMAIKHATINNSLVVRDDDD